MCFRNIFLDLLLCVSFVFTLCEQRNLKKIYILRWKWFYCMMVTEMFCLKKETNLITA